MVSQGGLGICRVAAVRALESTLLVVHRLDMALEGSRNGESRPALRADVALLLRMRPHVDREGVGVDVPHTALRAHVRLLSCVSSHVLFQGVRPGELFVACGTRVPALVVGLPSRLSVHRADVSEEAALLGEGLVALVAREGSLSCVGQHVPLEVSGPGKRFLAVRAGVGASSCSSLDVSGAVVPLQLLHAPETHATHAAPLGF